VIDPFKGLDGTGKVVIAIERLPAGLDALTLRRQTSPVVDPYTYAQQTAASAFVMIPRCDGGADPHPPRGNGAHPGWGIAPTTGAVLGAH